MAGMFILTQADLSLNPHVSVLRWFGLTINVPVLMACVSVLMLNSILFMGEIFQIKKAMRAVDYYSITPETVNNLVVAPCLEEFIYRVCLMNMVIESGFMTPMHAVFVMPLFFATSHLHLCCLDYLNGGKPLYRSLILALFKLTYTEVFGIYSGLVYVRTGSIWPAIVLHTQCNYFGFPHFLALIDNKFRLTDRIIPGILYVLGVIISYKAFEVLVPDLDPWWQHSH